MSTLAPVTITAPGFGGLNTQDSPVSMPIEYASAADNCVIDQFGRIAARKGYLVQTTSGAPDILDPITSIGYFEDEAGNTQVYSANSANIYSGIETLTSVYTLNVTAGNWQYINFNEQMIFLQTGHSPLVASAGGAPSLLNPTVSTGPAESVDGANVGLGAFGRLWLADTTLQKSVIYWSDLLNPAVFNAGSSGRIDLNDVWPQGQDEVKALAAHNGFLIIFGQHSILIYQGADDPSTMTLADTIKGVGCIARDSVQLCGNDLMFLSSEGVRSLGRVVQEKSLPNRDISGTVRDDVIAFVKASIDKSLIKSVYSPEESFYVLSFPSAEAAFVFDLRRPLENGYLRATRWIGSPFLAMTRDWNVGTLYAAGRQGIGIYDGYQDNGTSYQMKYFTHFLNFDQPVGLKFLKKIRPIIIGTSESSAIIRWSYDFNESTTAQALPLEGLSASEYGTAEWGIGEFGPATGLNVLNINTNGSGTLVKVGIEVEVNGSEFSIQELTMYATIGRTAW